MPKQLSGAAKRRLKKEREDAERRAILGVPDDGDTGAEDFAALGPPDLDNPETGLEYTRKFLLLSLYQIGKDPSLPTRDRWRMIRETGQAIGMTHPRASIESKVKRLVERREKAVESSGGLEPVRGIARPETARRARAGGGSEPLPRPLPDSSPSEDEGDATLGGRPVGPEES